MVTKLLLYKDVQVGELTFSNKKVALSIKIQLLRQKLFNKIELVEE